MYFLIPKLKRVKLTPRYCGPIHEARWEKEHLFKCNFLNFDLPLQVSNVFETRSILYT